MRLFDFLRLLSILGYSHREVLTVLAAFKTADLDFVPLRFFFREMKVVATLSWFGIVYSQTTSSSFVINSTTTTKVSTTAETRTTSLSASTLSVMPTDLTDNDTEKTHSLLSTSTLKVPVSITTSSIMKTIGRQTEEIPAVTLQANISSSHLPNIRQKARNPSIRNTSKNQVNHIETKSEEFELDQDIIGSRIEPVLNENNSSNSRISNDSTGVDPVLILMPCMAGVILITTAGFLLRKSRLNSYRDSRATIYDEPMSKRAKHMSDDLLIEYVPVSKFRKSINISRGSGSSCPPPALIPIRSTFSKISEMEWNSEEFTNQSNNTGFDQQPNNSSYEMIGFVGSPSVDLVCSECDPSDMRDVCLSEPKSPFEEDLGYSGYVDTNAAFAVAAAASLAASQDSNANDRVDSMVFSEAETDLFSE
jgi:hypothetical protein